VDGTVQVFAQTEDPNKVQKGLWDDEEMNGYQLLNEVGAGGTLSSLFTILSLFTEDIQISWQDDEPGAVLSGLGQELVLVSHDRYVRTESPASMSNDNQHGHRSRRSSSLSSSTSTIHGLHEAAQPRDSPMDPISERESNPGFGHSGSGHAQLHHGVVARASEDSTLAVIPAEAFSRLTKKFPKATGHMVQGMCHNLPLSFTWHSCSRSYSHTVLSCYFQCSSQVPRTHQRSSED
jgi:lysophospholipid hydrolase